MITCPNVKINLGLNVLRKRPDGYHDLETLFLPYYGIHDVLEIVDGDDYSRTSSGLFSRYGTGGGLSRQYSPAAQLAQAVSSDGKVMITIAREEGVGWDPADDLCVRAYAALDADFGLPPVKIFLEKLSPVGAGLGGGSSDAAFAIRMLNGMFSLGLDDRGMAGYAARLGSDCAFFIYNRPMIGEGRGEMLSEYSFDNIAIHGIAPDDGTEAVRPGPGSGTNALMEEYELKVAVPEGIAVSTADAYRGVVPAVPEIPLRDILAMPVSSWKEYLKNDFEKTVFARYPRLEAMKFSLYDSGAVYASMSGSGSALFGIYRK